MTHAQPAVWKQDDGVLPHRHVPTALMRGFRYRCPSCGHGRMFESFLKVFRACPACGEALHHHRADDAPPYFTIVLVGHVIIPLMLIVERTITPAIWVHTVIWTTLALVLCMVALPAVKGALVGYQWALYMHGFDPRSNGDETWDGVGFSSWDSGR